MDLPEEAKRAPPAPVWNQSFPSPKALFVRDTFFIRCYPLVHSWGCSPIRNLGTRVAAVVPQLAGDTASGTATATDTTLRWIATPDCDELSCVHLTGNASFTRNLRSWSVPFWLVFLIELRSSTAMHQMRSAAASLPDNVPVHWILQCTGFS